VFRACDLLVRQRTQYVNALRGHLLEYGHLFPKGVTHVETLVALVEDLQSSQSLQCAYYPKSACRQPDVRRFGRLPDSELVADNRDEVLAHVVVAWLVQLHEADLVDGELHQGVGVLAVGVPAVRPAQPHEALARRLDMGGVPCLAVDADLDLDNSAGAAPCIAVDHVNTAR
jgi:hypothetical protein